MKATESQAARCRIIFGSISQVKCYDDRARNISLLPLFLSLM